MFYAIGSLFFSQWLILDKHVDQIWYGLTFALSTILLLLTAPFLGAWSDKTGKRLPFLRNITFLLMVFGFILAFTINSPSPKNFIVILALIIFFILQYFYQSSLIFYNSLLDYVSNARNRGKISGIGNASGWFGGIIATFVLLQFAQKHIVLIGETGRAQVFLPAAVLFTVLTLPTILFFKEAKKENKTSFLSVQKGAISGIKELLKKNKNVTIFLFGFHFVADGLLTAILYFAIFLNEVYKIPDTQKFYILGIASVFAILGSFIFGKLGDKVGLKKMLLISCIDLVAMFLVIALTSKVWVLYPFAVILGLGWGGFDTTARALLIKISPPLELAEYFGFYSTFEKFASVTGPILWGIIILFSANYGVLKYRFSMAALIILMLIGTFLLTKVKEDKLPSQISG